MKKTFKYILGATAFIFSFAAFGGSNFNNSYYIPHVYLSGYGGSNLLGNLDVLAPVYLKADRNLYIYGAANYAGAEESDQDNSWSAEFGAGYRQMFNWTGNQRIYGAYLLGSYNYSSYGNDFWVINPGIESLGQRWDYRINGYIPLNNSFSYQDFASNHGDDSHVNAHDNQTDDMLVTYYENIGYGADAEFGGRLFSVYHMPIKGYIDGYYYNVDSSNNSDDPSNIYGVGARITFQPTSYLSLEVKDTYDNDKSNLFEVGAKIYFNGLRYGATNTHVDDQDLQVRLFDDIEHNFGTIDSGVSSFVRNSNTDPASDDYNGGGGDDVVPIEEHQIFYSADVTSGGDGTAENPYSASELDQGTIDTGYATWDDAQFVLASGSSSSYTPGSIEMYDGTSMVGKTSNYTALATGSDLPTVYGALTLDGNNTIDSIILLNDTKTAATNGITVAENAKNVVIENSTVGSHDFDDNAYQTGIEIKANSQVTINNSGISANTDLNATGIDVLDNANVNIIVSSVSGLSYGEGYLAVGLNSSNAVLNIVDTSVYSWNGYGSVVGLELNGGSANISGGSVSAVLNDGVDYSSAVGVNVKKASLTVNGGANIYVTDYSESQEISSTGLNIEQGSVIINDGDITVNTPDYSDSASAFGIYSVNSSLTIHETDILVSSAWATGIGLYARSEAYFEPTAGESPSINITLKYKTSYSYSTVYGRGIDAASSTLDFSNAGVGSISIIDQMPDGTLKSYGIYAKNSTITGYNSNIFDIEGFDTSYYSE